MTSSPLKLHLGCGERYLDGYLNIDFPPSEHSVQQTAPADEFADITGLTYPDGTVDEVRLHHVFEHFDRPTALRLLVDWRLWLGREGRLVIETPDFERCARAFAMPLTTRRRRGVLLRHMFGSHEAAWAVHWDGWYRDRYRRTLTALGFDDLEFERAKWRGTYNLTVTARPGSAPVDRAGLLDGAEQLLRESLVDDSASELELLSAWVGVLRRETR